MPRVTIVLRILTHYRQPFLEALRDNLLRDGIELALIYGQPSVGEGGRCDTVQLSWARRVDNYYVPLGHNHLVVQPILGELRGSDLIIVEQASRFVANYPLLCWQWLGGPKIAFWGHGRNFQAHRTHRMGEAAKRYFSRWAHWWFAYNDKSARFVGELGFPRERITSVQNAIDTRALRQHADAIKGTEVEEFRQAAGISSRNVGVFVGGMYADKRLEFLIASAELIRTSVHDFELLLIGGGESQTVAEKAAQRFSWVHYLGPLFGRDKVRAVLAGKIILMPGLVGLAILDAFALQRPLVTAAIDFHSPEIDYLIPDFNGVLVKNPDSVDDYAAAVAQVLTDERYMQRLQYGCGESSKRYTLEAMVERFATGIRQALAT